MSNPSVLQPVKLSQYNDRQYISSFQCADESSWYPHKYNAFDQHCQTMDDTFLCIDKYILTGISSADFELEKYIIFCRLHPFMYILAKYPDQIKDWVHLLATCIINNNSPEYMIRIIQTYSYRNMKLFPVKPEANELCWLCFQTHNAQALTTLLLYGDWLKDEWLEQLENKNYMQMLQYVAPKTQDDPSNPRNLVYALMRSDAELALQLINDGIQVDVWNNFAMKIVITHERFKLNKSLVKGMFNSGGRIPQYMNVLYKQREMIENAQGLLIQKKHVHQPPKEQPACIKKAIEKFQQHQSKVETTADEWSDNGWDDCIQPASFIFDEKTDF